MTEGTPDNFGLNDTHGITRSPYHRVIGSSDQQGWSSLYASWQRELPFEAFFDPVDHSFIVLHLQGGVIIDSMVGAKKEKKIVTSGSMSLIPAGQDFGVRVNNPHETLHLYVRDSVMEEVANDLYEKEIGKIEFCNRFGERDDFLEHLALGIRELLSDADPSATCSVDLLARTIASHLIRSHSSIASARLEAVNSGNLTRNRFAAAVEFMHANLDRSIGIDDIAQAVGLSGSHFARQFRASIGLPPHQFLIQLRLEQAKRLLKETNTSVAEIAFSSGFANQEHLTRLFRKYWDVTPASYRRLACG